MASMASASTSLGSWQMALAITPSGTTQDQLGGEIPYAIDIAAIDTFVVGDRMNAPAPHDLSVGCVYRKFDSA
jgi:hypothetical protein